MGKVHPLPSSPHQGESPVRPVPSVDQAANVRNIDDVNCALCGAKLPANGLRLHLVSPQCSETKLLVCRLCHKAALGEGYRPA